MSRYNISDHRFLIQDAVLEISQLEKEIKVMRSEISALRDDIEQLIETTRSFQDKMKTIRNEIPNAITNAALTTFAEEVEKFRITLDAINVSNQKSQYDDKNKWVAAIIIIFFVLIAVILNKINGS